MMGLASVVFGRTRGLDLCCAYKFRYLHIYRTFIIVKMSLPGIHWSNAVVAKLLLSESVNDVGGGLGVHGDRGSNSCQVTSRFNR